MLLLAIALSGHSYLLPYLLVPVYANVTTTHSIKGKASQCYHFNWEVKANLKLLRNLVPLHALFLNLRKSSSQCLVEGLLDLARGAEYLQYGRLTLAPTMVKFGTRHTEDSNNFLKRFVTRTHQIVPFLSWIVCQYAAKIRSKIE